MPESALKVDENLKQATLHIENASVVDDFERFGGQHPRVDPLDITWTGIGGPPSQQAGLCGPDRSGVG